MSGKKTILVLGDIILDILPTKFPIKKEKILSDGETFIEGVTFQRGGCGGNFACVLKSIYPEADVQFISRIGDDENGEFLIREMECYDVNQKFIKAQGIKTQITIAVSYIDGDRHFITYLGGLEDFGLDDIPEDSFNGVDHLAYRGPWFSPDLLFNCSTFLQKAKSNGVSISMDLGFDPYWNKEDGADNELLSLIKKRKQSILNGLQYVDFLFGNEEEYKRLTDTDTLDDAVKQLFQFKVKRLIMHRGAKGAALLSQNIDGSITTIDIPAIKVKIVNPVGSGDTFDSIFIAQVLEGSDPKKAAVFASAGAAYSIQSPGGTKITMEKIKRFIESQPKLKTIL